MNGYIVYIDGKQFEVYADTSFEAQQKAKALSKSRKKYPYISVHLVELAGEQVTTTIDY